MASAWANNTKDFEIDTVVGPSGKGLWLTFFAFLFFGGGTIFIYMVSSPSDGESALHIGGLVLGIISTAMFIFMVVRRLLKLPQIALTKTGIEYRDLIKTRTWSWEEVGPFVVQKVSMGRGSSEWLCAYSDVRHDAIVRETGSPQSPSFSDADISIQLEPIIGKRSPISSQELAKEMYMRRMVFGKPEDNSYVLTDDESKALVKEAKKRRRNGTITIVLLVIGVLTFFYFKHKDSALKLIDQFF